MNDDNITGFLCGVAFCLAVAGGIHALESSSRPAETSCWMYSEC